MPEHTPFPPPRPSANRGLAGGHHAPPLLIPADDASRPPAPGAPQGTQPRTTPPGHTPGVIAHRGASGYRPENTLAAFELAARLGADRLHADLVPTRDGVLVARSGPELSESTDVACRPRFTNRCRSTSRASGSVTGWFVQDLTLEQLKMLRARERLPLLRPENTAYDREFDIPTLEEIIELSRRLSRELRREIGLCLELRCPTYFADAGHPPDAPLLDTLDRADMNHAQAPVFVQAFEPAVLRGLRTRGLLAPLIQLVAVSGAPDDLRDSAAPRTHADLLTPAGLEFVTGYAQGIGPDKVLVAPWSPEGSVGTPVSVLVDAQSLGLLVHPRRFRAEGAFLPATLQPRLWDEVDFTGAVAEVVTYMRSGVDAVCTDHPDIAVIARREARRGRSTSGTSSGTSMFTHT